MITKLISDQYKVAPSGAWIYLGGAFHGPTLHTSTQEEWHVSIFNHFKVSLLGHVNHIRIYCHPTYECPYERPTDNFCPRRRRIILLPPEFTLPWSLCDTVMDNKLFKTSAYTYLWSIGGWQWEGVGVDDMETNSPERYYLFNSIVKSVSQSLVLWLLSDKLLSSFSGGSIS